MKKTIFVLLLFPVSLFSQSPVTMPAGTGTDFPSSACLSCPGSDWNNAMNITANDALVADVSLNQNGFCFQSSCFYSRFLYAHNFGFAIPGNATIDSILVSIIRNAGAANSIRDSIVQLYDSTTTVGNNLAQANPWNSTFTTVNYGHSDPLWGASWTPALLNNSGMGVVIKVENLLNTAASAGVDYVSMTVYYSTASGIHSVSSGASSVEWMDKGNEIVAQLNSAGPVSCTGSVYAITGQLIQHYDYGILNPGENQMVFDKRNFEEGIYFWQLIIGDQKFSKKIIVQAN